MLERTGCTINPQRPEMTRPTIDYQCPKRARPTTNPQYPFKEQCRLSTGSVTKEQGHYQPTVSPKNKVCSLVGALSPVNH